MCGMEGNTCEVGDDVGNVFDIVVVTSRNLKFHCLFELTQLQEPNVTPSPCSSTHVAAPPRSKFDAERMFICDCYKVSEAQA